VDEIFCPVCAREIRPVEFGGGRVWVCCGKVAHSASHKDKSKKRGAEGDQKAEGVKT